MINQLLYLVGAPGVGKSTVAGHLTARWDRELMRGVPVPHSRMLHPVSRRLVGLELGVPRPDFPGTDALAMDVGPRALQFLSTQMVPFALGEGSRLATQPFIGGLARAGVDITLVRLTADEELLTERWRARGSKQSPSWRKGAATRATRLTEWFSSGLATFPGRCTLLDLDVTEAEAHDTADRIRDVFPLVDLRESAS
jgi:hypothetical protein